MQRTYTSNFFIGHNRTNKPVRDITVSSYRFYAGMGINRGSYDDCSKRGLFFRWSNARINSGLQVPGPFLTERKSTLTLFAYPNHLKKSFQRQALHTAHIIL